MQYLTGKETNKSTDHTKTFNMEARLNDKNLAQLEGASTGDIDLMMTTPAQLGQAIEGAHGGADVKTEFPTLPLLEEAMKAPKKTYLTQAAPYTFSMRLPIHLQAIPTKNSAIVTLPIAK